MKLGTQLATQFPISYTVVEAPLVGGWAARKTGSGAEQEFEGWGAVYKEKII